MNIIELRRKGLRLLALLLVWVLLLGCAAETTTQQSTEDQQQTVHTQQTDETPQETPSEDEEINAALSQVKALNRMQLLSFPAAEQAVTAAVPTYTVEPDLSNLVNLNQFYFTDEDKSLLAENLFVVKPSYSNEFFEIYEENRYSQVPNFVTVDSMMHTYHLYFSLLLSRTEKQYLSSALEALSVKQLEVAKKQYEALSGSEWEEAARVNLAFYAVAARLQNGEVEVPGAVTSLVEQELSLITNAANIAVSPLTGANMDYTQFKPRGYYEGDAVLEAYFRAMMWYGQVNFLQNNETLNRCALLMTLALQEGGIDAWETIYTVTSFFAGTSDDLSYYEYAPAIEAAYGGFPSVEDLIGDSEHYQTFVKLVSTMAPPAINSVPVWEGTENIPERTKGFRVMGQRFTIDAAVMQQLVYSNVKENAQGEKRMLPDVLDMPAALGSDLALTLLEEQGATGYENYSENMEKLREVVAKAPESTWTSSLYSSWLYTLSPILEEKGEGYPSFMTSEAWHKKSLECFAGSFTELKHDTVLYAKQVMAEMGGGPVEEIDDRGYVEPEVEVYRRFALLAQQTADGLERYGYLGDSDKENLTRLAELAGMLQTISEKELRNETLSEEEYELIRAYGGTLEHFWIEAVQEQSQSPYLEAKEIPSALVTDIATDPNGTVLQIATGRPARIYVVVPVDGTLRLASGLVYDFYQFEYPMSERLTDSTWRQMIGVWAKEDGTYNWDAQVAKPWWTESYWSKS